MDPEVKQHLVSLYQAIKGLEERTQKLSISVKALVEASVDGSPAFFDRYSEAFGDQELQSKTEEQALAIEQLQIAIQAMLAAQTGQA